MSLCLVKCLYNSSFGSNRFLCRSGYEREIDSKQCANFPPSRQHRASVIMFIFWRTVPSKLLFVSVIFQSTDLRAGADGRSDQSLTPWHVNRLIGDINLFTSYIFLTSPALRQAYSDKSPHRIFVCLCRK